jgi:MFS transporter, putative metabolite:H+ symporter
MPSLRGPNPSDDIGARLDRLPVSRFHFVLLGIAAISLLFDGLDAVVTTFVLSNLRTVWQIDVATIGVVSAIGFGGYLVGAAASGFVADRIGRKKTVLLTLVCYSLFSGSRGLANGVASLAALHFLTFIFIGAESATVPPYLAEFWPARVRGKMNGVVMSFFGIGIALSPVWALLIIPHLGWRWAFFLTAPFALVAGLMRSRLPESPRWLARVGRMDEADSVVAGIEVQVERETHRTLPAVVARPAEPQASAGAVLGPKDLLARGYRSTTLMLWMAWFAQFAVFYLFLTFVPTILAGEGYAIVKSFGYSVVILGAAIPAFVLGGQIVEWIDRKFAVLLAFAAAALFGTLFGLSTQPWAFMVFGGLTSFALALGSTAVYTYTPELYPTEVRVTGMGIASAWGRIGAITALLVFGFLFKTQGKSLIFVMSDSILIAGAIVVVIFGPSTRGRRLEDTSRPESPATAGEVVERR